MPLVTELRELVADLPMYGYRRAWALLRRSRDALGQPRVNATRVYRVMRRHGLLLERRARHAPSTRRHDGKVAVDRSNVRWCSDGFEFRCDDGPEADHDTREKSAEQSDSQELRQNDEARLRFVDAQAQRPNGAAEPGHRVRPLQRVASAQRLEILLAARVLPTGKFSNLSVTACPVMQCDAPVWRRLRSQLRDTAKRNRSKTQQRNDSLQYERLTFRFVARVQISVVGKRHGSHSCNQVTNGQPCGHVLVAVAVKHPLQNVIGRDVANLIVGKLMAGHDGAGQCPPLRQIATIGNFCVDDLPGFITCPGRVDGTELTSVVCKMIFVFKMSRKIPLVTLEVVGEKYLRHPRCVISTEIDAPGRVIRGSRHGERR